MLITKSKRYIKHATASISQLHLVAHVMLMSNFPREQVRGSNPNAMEDNPKESSVTRTQPSQTYPSTRILIANTAISSRLHDDHPERTV